MKNAKWLSIFLSLFSLVFLNSCKDRLFDNPLDPDADKKAYEILATIPISGIVPLDLTFPQDSIWVVDQASRILSLNYNSGIIIRELEVEKQVNGIAFDGDGLWLSVRDHPQIIKISMANGSIVRTLDFPKGDFGAMDFYDEKLYIADRLQNAIILVNLVNGEIIKTIPNPGFSLNAVVFDGTYLWSVDSPQLRIYKLTPDGTVLFYYQTPAKGGAGMAYSMGFMWLGDQSGKIYKLRFQ